jgi:hypothetical protein
MSPRQRHYITVGDFFSAISSDVAHTFLDHSNYSQHGSHSSIYTRVSNFPLHTYLLSPYCLPDALIFSPHEREIVGHRGASIVVGRSGTGKG